MALDRVEPFGDFRDDSRIALLAAVVANFSLTKKKGKWIEPDRFMLNFKEDGSASSRKPKGDPKALLARAVLLNTILGGRDLRSGGR